MKKMTKEHASLLYLEDYAKKNNILHISELFSKDTLIECTYESDWMWSINDEIVFNNCSEEEAQKKTYDWFNSMTKLELWTDRISDGTKRCLIEDKAEELGFLFK